MNADFSSVNMSSSGDVLLLPVADHADHDMSYLHPPVSYILAAIFGFLIIFSVSGNLLVLLILVRFRRMRTRTNLLLANMSAIDLLTGLLSMPFSMITAFSGKWVLGDTACQINGFCNAMFIAASIHTLMYISIHKYFSIRNVFKTTITTKHIICMMAAAWIWGLLFATGLVAGWTNIEYKIGTTQCGPKVPDRNNIRESSHSIFTSVTNFVIPLVVIVFCYSAIFHTFARHISTLGDDGQHSNVASAQRRAFLQQKKIAITLIIVLVCFLICVLPYILYSSAIAFAKDKLIIPRIMNPIAYIFLYLASCVNPVIYALRSEAFLQAYRNFLCCKTHQFKRSTRRNTDPTIDFPDKSGWRRLSVAILDAFHMAVSRETLTSATRSRQNSLFGTHQQVAAGSRRDSPAIGSRRGSPATGIIPLHHVIDDRHLLTQPVNSPLHTVIYRQYSAPQAILEERSSQLAKWDKNPDTDSGRAESDGEFHEGVDQQQPHQPAGREEEITSGLVEERESLLHYETGKGEEGEEFRLRLPLPLGLVDTNV